MVNFGIYVINMGWYPIANLNDRGPMEELQIGSRVDGVMGEFWNGLSAIFQNNLIHLQIRMSSFAYRLPNYLSPVLSESGEHKV